MVESKPDMEISDLNLDSEPEAEIEGSPRDPKTTQRSNYVNISIVNHSYGLMPLMKKLVTRKPGMNV